MDLFEQLRLSPEFAEFSMEELLSLSKAIAVKKFASGFEFVREGEKGDTLYFLISGNVLVTRTSPHGGGKEYVERLTDGALFGLISLIDHGKRAATCRADGSVMVGSLPRNVFDLLCNNNAGLSQHFQFLIGRQLANDMRIYNEALSNLIRYDDNGAFFGAIRAASYEYRGIERRKRERRHEADRRSRTDQRNDNMAADDRIGQNEGEMV